MDELKEGRLKHRLRNPMVNLGLVSMRRENHRVRAVPRWEEQPWIEHVDLYFDMNEKIARSEDVAMSSRNTVFVMAIQRTRGITQSLLRGSSPSAVEKPRSKRGSDKSAMDIVLSGWVGNRYIQARSGNQCKQLSLREKFHEWDNIRLSRCGMKNKRKLRRALHHGIWSSG